MSPSHRPPIFINTAHAGGGMLTRVLAQVLLEVAKVVKVLVAVLAHVHPLLRTLAARQLLRLEVEGGDVQLERALPRVGLAAVGTHVRLVKGPGVRLHVLLEVVVELEAALALVTAEHIVHLGDLHFHHLHVLQHLGGRHRLLLVRHLLGSHKRDGEHPQSAARKLFVSIEMHGNRCPVRSWNAYVKHSNHV